jgi:hypothetical protein
MEPVKHLQSLYPGPAPVISHLGPFSFFALPNWWRRRLAGLHPNFAVVNFACNPGQSVKLNLNMPPGTWIVSTRATVLTTATGAPNPAGIRVAVLNPLEDAGLTQRPLDSRDFFGTGQYPFVYTHPLHIRDTTPLLIKIANRDLVNAVSGQLVFETYYEI